MTKCQEAGDNVFIFQIFCLGYRKKVVHRGPYIFKGLVVMIEDYDGVIDPSKVVFDGLYLWAKIHNIPERYRHDAVVDDLAKRIGRVREVQMSSNLLYEGNYVRVRVRVQVKKGLARFVSLNDIAKEEKGYQLNTRKYLSSARFVG